MRPPYAYIIHICAQRLVLDMKMEADKKFKMETDFIENLNLKKSFLWTQQILVKSFCWLSAKNGTAFGLKIILHSQ